MKRLIYLFAMLALISAGCKNAIEPENTGGHQHEDVKIQLTAYSNEFELFAEADPFVVGHKSNILSHFSHLPDFKAMESGSITIRLVVKGKVKSKTLAKPTRKGIYSFDLKAETAGVGHLVFDITTEKGVFQLIVPEVRVYANEHDAFHAAEETLPSKTNTTVFTKEQSWKIDFASGFPRMEPFGQVIKTTAQVQSAQGDEMIVSAKTNGIVMLSNSSILEGNAVSKGQVLLSVSGSELADNNISLRFAEAKNNFEKAASEYDRAKELANDKIVSEKDLLNAKNQYDNARAIYDNLNKNFNTTGQRVTSPMNGFIKQIFVHNGSYVEAGQPIASISQNKNLVLSAEVQPKYASALSTILSANIRTLHDNQTYSLEQLNGRVLSFGKSANNDNYLIPVKLQIDNKGSFTPGSFVEIYLKTLTNAQAITLPVTALLEDQGTFFVYAQITPELFEKREVKVGTTDGIKSEILSGITQNDRIVTKGAIFIKLAQATGTLDAHSGHVH